MKQILAAAVVILFLFLPEVRAQDIRFRIGEPRKTFVARMDSMRIRISKDSKNDVLRIEDEIQSAGLISYKTLILLEKGRTVGEGLFFNNPNDTIYAHFARKLGPPIAETYDPKDSSYTVTFRDKTFDYQLVDSTVVIQAHISGLSDRKWQLLAEDEFAQSYMDTSLDYEHYFMVKRAVKPGDPLGAGALLDIKYPDLGYDKFAYSYITYEVDCKRKAILKRNRVDYTVDDKFIRYDNAPDKEWWTPDSDNVLSQIIDNMCN